MSEPSGREVLEREAGEKITDSIYAMGFVCVPRVATDAMLNAARYDAMAEDANGVWESMIGAAEGNGRPGQE